MRSWRSVLRHWLGAGNRGTRRVTARHEEPYAGAPVSTALQVDVATPSARLKPSASADPRGLDVPLLAAMLTILGLGLVMIYSSSAIFAGASYHDGGFFLKRQLAYTALGLGALYLGWRIDYRSYEAWTYPLLGLTLLLLVALLVPGFGTRVDGATRWFRLGGLSFQPSELAKLSLCLYLAHSLAKKRSQLRLFSIGFLPHLCVAGVMALLVLKQPDLGTSAILIAVTLLALFIAGTRLSYIVLAVLAAAPLAYQQIVGTPWRLRRLIAFLDPWACRRDAGYQISESLISIGSGGLSGLGLGAGKQKLFFLPAAHTDFIFATSGEELGFIGLVVLVLLFAFVVWRGLRAALGATELYGSLLAFSLSATFGLQALVHMAVVLGMMPTKGIPLPLYSYGGSGLIVQLFAMGILLNIAARNAPLEPDTAAHGLAHANANRKRPPRVVVST